MTTIELTDVEIELDYRDQWTIEGGPFGPLRRVVHLEELVLEVDNLDLTAQANDALRRENAHLEAENEQLARANGILKRNITNTLESWRIALNDGLNAKADAEVQRDRADVAEWEFERLSDCYSETVEALAAQLAAVNDEADALQARVNELEQPISLCEGWSFTVTIPEVDPEIMGIICGKPIEPAGVTFDGIGAVAVRDY